MGAQQKKPSRFNVWNYSTTLRTDHYTILKPEIRIHLPRAKTSWKLPETPLKFSDWPWSENHLKHSRTIVWQWAASPCRTPPTSFTDLENVETSCWINVWIRSAKVNDLAQKASFTAFCACAAWHLKSSINTVTLFDYFANCCTVFSL